MNAEMKTPPYSVEHWTHTLTEADYQQKKPQTITVNDRAATRQAIITSANCENVAFVERSDWAAHKNKPEGMTDDWNYSKIAIHHAGRSYSCGPAALQMQEIQLLHMNKHKWPDIGYHYAIDCFGTIYEGRDIRYKGSHLDGYNTGVIGIVLLENLSTPDQSHDSVGFALSALRSIGFKKDAAVPTKQKVSAKNFITVLRRVFSISVLGGHQEFPKQNSVDARLCPGALGMSLVDELRVWSGLSRP